MSLSQPTLSQRPTTATTHPTTRQPEPGFCTPMHRPTSAGALADWPMVGIRVGAPASPSIGGTLG